MKAHGWGVRLALIGLALAATAAKASHAQLLFLYDWTSPAGGSYASQFNWNPLGVPDSAGELARFQLDATYSVQLAANYTVGSLALREAGNVTFAFQDPGSFNPRYIYTTDMLRVHASGARTTALTLAGGDVRVTTAMALGTAGTEGQTRLDVNGTTLTTGAATIGEVAGSVGHLSVDDIGDWSSTGEVLLGGEGDGYLNVLAHYRTSSFGPITVHSASQGVVTNAGVVMAQGAQSTGTATIFGRWTTGDLIVGDAGDADLGVFATQLLVPGTSTNVSSAGSLDSANVNVGAQPGSAGNVDIAGFALQGFTPLASDWEITGNLALGGTAGAAGGIGRLGIGTLNQVNVGGNLKLWSGGQLSLHDLGVLDVAGAANLAGVLQFILPDTTHPQLGNVYQILTAGNVSGRFASTILPPLDPGLAWAVRYAATSVSLEVVPGFTADFDDDGDVDGNDLVQWRGDFGENSQSDADNDGDSDGADFLAWQQQFGSDSAMATVAVPEPAAISLSCLAVAAARPRGATRRWINADCNKSS